MTTKQYLKQISRLENLINNKLSEIYQLKSLSCSISAVTDGERVKSTPSMDKIGDSVAKILEVEEEIDNAVMIYLKTKTLIISQIESLEEDEYNVLFSRYIEKMSPDKIAEKLSFSSVHIWRIEKKALENFEKMYGNTYLSRKM